MNINELEKLADDAIKVAYESGDSKGDLAKEACRLHQEWLKTLNPSAYSKGAYLALAKAYMSDPNLKNKFRSKFACGTAEFLLEALTDYLK